MALWNRYFTPATVEEALQILARYQGQARVIAGGTDLLLAMQQGRHPPLEALVDVTKIVEFDTISLTEGAFALGAGVTHHQIVRSEALRRRATCLVESCGVVGGPQVRNVGTLGGNVAHALPAADGTTALVALDAQVEMIRDGRRERRAILEMFAGPGRSVIDSHRDLLTRFTFKASGPHQGSAFKRIMRPQGVALPILGCAVWVALDPAHGYIDDIRLSLAPVAAIPTRPRQTEAALIGQPLNRETLERAAAVIGRELQPRSSRYRATAAYRKLMIDLLLRRTLPLAVERARTGRAEPEFEH